MTLERGATRLAALAFSTTFNGLVESATTHKASRHALALRAEGGGIHPRRAGHLPWQSPDPRLKPVLLTKLSFPRESPNLIVHSIHYYRNERSGFAALFCCIENSNWDDNRRRSHAFSHVGERSPKPNDSSNSQRLRHRMNSPETACKKGQGPSWRSRAPPRKDSAADFRF